MAAGKAQSAQPQAANLRPDQMRAAIPTLHRRIEELRTFDPTSIQQRSDPRIETLDKKLDETIASIFGMGTQEYLRYAPRDLDGAGYNLAYPIPLSEVMASLVESKAREIANLQAIIESFEEKLADGSETPATKARRAFGDLDLHPDIAQESTKLFEDGHYSAAVETACKVLEMLVQRRSLKNDLSGTALMRTVFSVKTPILTYNDLQSETGRSEQEGMMHLFEGAVLALRNPRAHGIIDDHPERAVEYLSFLSMLARSLDRTQRV
ncbi:TIGR02391 family protein [Paraburkholderia haematera]|uniref:Conserved hypothetical protein CHP02391 domain-containing protein n=1 Tax=Paraburkholderia haematera TaxID=2793077 RepID=A0ABN7M308_9BURK|nr:TIGR02391 family protein [Paraburkholderia haematera]CAE6782866.1 hypothetical protein R69888_04387 [Paraburkholderia haematera]